MSPAEAPEAGKKDLKDEMMDAQSAQEHQPHMRELNDQMAAAKTEPGAPARMEAARAALNEGLADDDDTMEVTEIRPRDMSGEVTEKLPGNKKPTLLERIGRFFGG